jgi:hypothetical protein
MQQQKYTLPVLVLEEFYRPLTKKYILGDLEKSSKPKWFYKETVVVAQLVCCLDHLPIIPGFALPTTGMRCTHMSDMTHEVLQLWVQRVARQVTVARSKCVPFFVCRPQVRVSKCTGSF